MDVCEEKEGGDDYDNGVHSISTSGCTSGWMVLRVVLVLVVLRQKVGSTVCKRLQQRN